MNLALHFGSNNIAAQTTTSGENTIRRWNAQVSVTADSSAIDG
jgi:hypothetical protein